MEPALNSVVPVSIIISSYNYSRYVDEAIESALTQSYSATEVIVVDDGSTDNSLEVITRYADCVRVVAKKNGGQASVFNAGFALSRGDIVIFLDSDDVLLPGVVAEVVSLFDADTSKVHWPLWDINADGVRTGEITPRDALSEGELRSSILRAGADGYTWPPTSGNAWSRRFLEQILPMPEPEYRTCPDYYLSTLAPLFGVVRRLTEPRSCWRIHGKNQSWAQPLGQRLEVMKDQLDHCLGTLYRHCKAYEIDLNVEQCRANSWWQWLRQQYLATQELERIVPPGEQFILVDDATWDPREVAVTDRRAIPFLEKNGMYWGPPPDTETALRELDRLRRQGASFIAFAWPCFWWLDYYKPFAEYLRSSYLCVLENDRLTVFDLRC